MWLGVSDATAAMRSENEPATSVAAHDDYTWPAAASRLEEENTMRTATLGNLTVPRLGLGAMGMSGVYGTADETESVRTLHGALELGVTLIDTAEIYGPITTRSCSAGR
jgi:hypothetical protein